MKITRTQIGTALTADFEELTWTFEMPEGYEISAGEFAIVPKEEYDKLCQTPTKRIEMYKECFERYIPSEKWDEATIFLSTYGSGLAKELAKKGI